MSLRHNKKMVCSSGVVVTKCDILVILSISFNQASYDFKITTDLIDYTEPS